MNKFSKNETNNNTNFTLNDSEIIKKILKGEKDLFAILVRKYENLIFSYALARLRDIAEVQDIVQETFIKAYKHLTSFNTDKKFSCWIITIAKNLIYDKFKKSSTLQKQIDNNVNKNCQNINKTKVVEPQIHVLMQEEFNEVLKNIHELPEDLRIPLLLKIVNDMSYEEIAEHLDVNIQTVKNRIFKARQILRSRRNENNEV